MNLEALTEKSFEIIEKLENEDIDDKYFRKEVVDRLKEKEENIYDFKKTYIKNCYLYVNLTNFLSVSSIIFGGSLGGLVGLATSFSGEDLSLKLISSVLGFAVGGYLSNKLLSKKFSEPLEKFVFLNSKNERHVFVHAGDWDKKYSFSLGAALLRIK